MGTSEVNDTASDGAAGGKVHHRFRFGLRTLLALTTLAAVIFALAGHRWYEVRKRRATIAAFEGMGVTNVNYGGPFTSKWLQGTLGEDFVSNPQGISLHAARLDNEQFAQMYLAPFPAISIDSYHLNDDGAAAFDDLVGLEYLALRDTSVGDGALAHLSGCTNLESIFIESDVRPTGLNITDNGLKHLAPLKRLQYLHFGRTHITGTGFANLGGCRLLSTVALSRSPINGEGLAEIAQLPTLTSLELMETNVTDGDLVHLANLKNLKHLALGRTKIGNRGMQYLAGLRNIERLGFENTNVGDDGLVHLSNMKRLTNLYLSGTAVTDAGLVHLKGLANPNSERDKLMF